MIAAWLTLEQFMAASGWSRSNVYTLQRKGIFETRKEGRSTLYAASSLPPAARAKLESLSKPKKELRHIEPACAPASLLAPTAAQGPGRRILLLPEQERQAKAKLAILQPFLDYCSEPSARARALALLHPDGKAVTTADRMAEYIAEKHSTPEQPITRPTLWRWKAAYLSRGLEGLARKVREDKGQSKWAQRFPQAAELAAATFLTPHSTRQRAYDALVRDRVRLGLSEADLPSYASVCDFLATLPPPAVVWAREGERSHHERMSSYLSRGYTDVDPNKVWVADTMLFDALVRNDCFGTCGNEAVRLQLTALMDLRSRKIVGYAFCLNGSSRSITTALIAAVKRYGPCEQFYVDNGKDFKKVGRGAQPVNGEDLALDDMQEIERTGALRQLGISVQYCIPFHPQSKPIERFFRTLHLKFDMPFPHYTAGNAYKRPDQTNAAAALHGKVLQMGTPEISPLLPASHFIRMATLWIEEEYNAQHKHSGRAMNHRTPDEVFAPALQARREFDPAILDTLLWRRERRLVRNCAVTVDERRLVGASEFASRQLYMRNKSEVIVCFDPNAPETGVITDLDGHKLCDVTAEVFAPHSAEAAPLIESSMRGNRGRRNDMAASVRNLRSRVVRSGHQTFTKLLHDRALPIAVGETITQPLAPRRIGRSNAAPKYAYEIADDVLGDME